MTRINRFAAVSAIVFGFVVIAGPTVAAQKNKAATGGDFTFFNQEPDQIVKGAPYSGEGITTVKLTMFDGTKIERTVTAKFYRDSAGRVRREQTVVGLEALDPKNDFRAVVQILDPVAGVAYMLNPGSRTAERLPLTGLIPPIGVGKFVKGIGQKREEALGTKDIDGISAIGTRIISTIPAGQIGNDRPIEIIEERWASTELKVLVRSLYRDPRSGDVEYVLTKISRAEPPASMFTVPAGYEIRDLGAVKR